MDKRFILFMIVAMSLMLAFIKINNMLMPPAPQGEDVADGDDKKDGKKDADDQDADGKGGDDQDADKDADDKDADDKDADDKDAHKDADKDGDTNNKGEGDVPAIGGAKPAVGQTDKTKWRTVGQFRGSGLPYLAYFSNRGGTLDRLELVERDANGRLIYRALEQSHGYLGYMALTTLREGGALVQVVGTGTPAYLAKADGLKGGLHPGDVIVGVNGESALSVAEIDRFLAGVEPDEVVELTVIRKTAPVQEDDPAAKPGNDSDSKSKPSENGAADEEDAAEEDAAEEDVAEEDVAEEDAAEEDATEPETELVFKVKLTEKPLVLIGDDDSVDSPPKGRSAFTLAINQYKDQSAKVDTWALPKGGSLETTYWDVVKIENSIVFTTEYSREDDLIEIEKSFRFSVPSKKEAKEAGAQYRFAYNIRARAVSKTSPLIGFRIDGPRGLPIEGWWYLNKIHPSMFNSAGTRDVTWNLSQGGHQIRGTKSIFSQAKKDESQPFKPIFVGEHVAERRNMRYIGVDTAYFNVSLLPADYADGGTMRFAAATPIAASHPDDIEKKRFKLCDTSFWLTTEPVQLGHVKPDEKEWPFQQNFVVFAGPKRRDVLETFGLHENIYYGWFGFVAKPLSVLLHFFHAIVRNYGIAIIMLTIFVRACIFPLSRKAARNAQIMQILGPEMKKLAEKHKNDMEKRGAAQRELYDRYDFNPFGGCGLALLQLPIFMGLYRCISVDIDLRQSELIPGWNWCSNLAGPDMLWNWPAPEFLAAKTAWFGPYLNILPLITIFLFILQQKMFTPPATDDQTRTQQAMMKYMMIFIGVLFFKVPAGLCIYFIASSIWSIGERKLIPKPGVDLAEMEKRAAEKKKNGGEKRPGLLQRAMSELKKNSENGSGRAGDSQTGQARSGQAGGGQGGGRGGRPGARRRRKK